MASEIQLRVSLQIKKGKLDYRSSPTAFNADQIGVGGPTPGAINVPISGVKIDLSQLTVPGVCWFQNQDQNVSIEIGVHDGEYFRPMLELGPGECYPVRLSRHLNMRETVTGTGTISTAVNDLWVKPLTLAPTAPTTVDAFER